MSQSDGSFCDDMSVTYPTGHLHHLSADQARAFDRFKTLLRQLQSPNVTGLELMPSHVDETLLRFLRARNFVPEDALKQYLDTALWRKKQLIDEWYDLVDVEDYEQTRILVRRHLAIFSESLFAKDTALTVHALDRSSR